MISAHVNVADLLCLNVQENLTMVLELVYSDDERRVAQRTSKQIWEILYKDTVAPDVMQTEGSYNIFVSSLFTLVFHQPPILIIECSPLYCAEAINVAGSA